MFTKICVIFRTLNSDARTFSTKPDFSDICDDLIFYYNNDGRGAGLDANNVAVAAYWYDSNTWANTHVHMQFMNVYFVQMPNLNWDWYCAKNL